MAIDARRFPRVGIKAFAAVSATGKADIYKEYNATCVNISEGGCCLQLDVLLSGADIDFGVTVGIELPDNKPRLIINGRIVWLKEFSHEKFTKYLVGIEFHNVKPEDKQRIIAFIHGQMGNSK
jgi:c-di-GMP-binding flagellar brake protein YcgR